MKQLYHTYSVKPGETIASIARENNMDTLELGLVNKLACPFLRTGQQLMIPFRNDQSQSEMMRGPEEAAKYRQYEFSKDYMKTVIKDVKLSDTVISPNGDGVQDTVTVTFNIAEKMDSVYAFIVNEVSTYVAQVNVLNTVPGVSYSFTWNGKDERGGSLYNGNYYVLIGVSKSEGYGDLIFRDKPIRLVGSKDIVVPQPVEKVKITNIDARISTLPTGMDYTDDYGKTYPILGFEIDPWKGERYLIKVAEGVAGYVKAADVEMVEYDKLPKLWGKPAIEGVFARTGPAVTYPVVEMLRKDELFRVLRKDGSWYRILLSTGKQAYLPVTDVELTSIIHPVAAGDVLWKLAQKYGVTIEAIAKANNIDTAATLSIGQQLKIPVPETANPYLAETGAPYIRYVKLSSRTIAYDSLDVPGYLTIDMETTVPTKGYIEVKGGAVSTRINLSTEAFKKEHIINWVPWDDVGKKPLPVGEYELILHLTGQEGTEYPAVSLGKINVVEKYLKKGFVVGFRVNPDTITPRYNYTEPLTTITYGVSRHAMGQIVIKDDKREYFHSPLESLTPEKTYSTGWDGRDDQGGLMPNGTYTVEFRAIDLDYNDPDIVPRAYQTATIRVYGGDYRIPEARIRQVVKEAKLNGTTISPNGDGINDTISGTVTFYENTKADIWVINSARVHIKQVLPSKEYTAGTHPFTWDGKDFNGSGVLNGTYGLRITIFEGDNYGSLILENLKIQVTGAYDLEIPKPEQRVRVISDEAEMAIDPMMQGYIGKKGEIYPLIEYTTQLGDFHYKVKVGDSAAGYVRVEDVEMIDLNNLPEKWGKVIAAGTIARSRPANYHEIIEVLPKDAVVRILRQDGDWYRILLSSGKQGYVKTSEVAGIAAPVPIPGTLYTVVPGDTLWKLSQRFSVTIDAIARANNISSSTPLMVGQKLIIPAKPVEAVEPRAKLIYTVKPGDALWKIAQAHGVTVNELLAANKLAAADQLMIGQRLMVPVVYVVAAGDSLWKIAALYKTTVQRLAQLGGLDISKPLYIGQRIMIST